jgi:2-polyprenyl-6-methoxyphenol hydroxylase-like FAD-dependent oxidoreductase
MALDGRNVLVLERETEFKDRVRGEQMASWGAGEARELGIYDLLCGSCANEMRYWDVYVGPNQMQHRDLTETTPSGLPNLGFFHPEMQDTLVAEAAQAGAEVRRGARVRYVAPGDTPSVTFDLDGTTETVEARLVVGADGRGSVVRKWGDFELIRDPERLMIAGLLLDDTDADDETMLLANNPTTNRRSLVFPQGGGRIRSYIGYHVDDDDRYSGDDDVDRYIEDVIATGSPASLYENAKPNGPLATFNGADSWVPHPYRNGVALIGDAAATSDPSWGQGLSLTVHDVRLLRDKLLESDDWDAAGHAYAEAHDRDYGIVHESEDWFARILANTGPEAKELQSRVLPRMMQDPDYLPDTFQSGPEHVTLDPERKREIFGD